VAVERDADARTANGLMLLSGGSISLGILFALRGFAGESARQLVRLMPDDVIFTDRLA
jgi:hypothetical protein